MNGPGRSYLIRPARSDDGAALRDIERLAGERFRDVGLAGIADAEPLSTDALAVYADAGRSWVALDPDGVPAGYVLVDVVDGCAHVEQVSVLPVHQGLGVGRVLLDQVRAWATSTRRPGITLSTFADVPWNRPLYEHLGFRILPRTDIGPGLRAVCDSEAAHGIDLAPRVCMRLELGEGLPPCDPTP